MNKTNKESITTHLTSPSSLITIITLTLSLASHDT